MKLCWRLSPYQTEHINRFDRYTLISLIWIGAI